MRTILGYWTTVGEVLKLRHYRDGNFELCGCLLGMPWLRFGLELGVGKDEFEKLSHNHPVFAGEDYDYDSLCDGEVVAVDEWLVITCGCSEPEPDDYDDEYDE